MADHLESKRMGVIADALVESRERTLALVAPVNDDQLERVHSSLMSPLVWDLGHIAAFEDLWIVHRYGGRPLLRDELMDVYDAFETPRAQRGTLPYLRPVEARDFLDEVRERSLEVLAERGEDLVAELVIRHEQQHCETMLQTLALARLPGYTLSTAAPAPIRTSPEVSGLEMVTVPAGEVTIGAGANGFAYDNERPQHTELVPGFRIGRAPVSNADYLEFVMRGGYDHRNWWSQEGWAWKQQYDITKPGAGPRLWTASGASTVCTHSTRRNRSSTCPGSRRTPSREPTTPGCRPRRSGRRRRPGIRSATRRA